MSSNGITMKCITCCSGLYVQWQCISGLWPHYCKTSVCELKVHPWILWTTERRRESHLCLQISNTQGIVIP